MPHSTTSSVYTRSINSRSNSQTSLSTAATSRASTLQSANKLYRKASTNPRKPRPKSQPGDWNSLLGIPLDHSNTPSQRSSLRITQSYSDLVGGSNFENNIPPVPIQEQCIQHGARTGTSRVANYCRASNECHCEYRCADEDIWRKANNRANRLKMNSRW
jgi:hypothetical protein